MLKKIHIYFSKSKIMRAIVLVLLLGFSCSGVKTLRAEEYLVKTFVGGQANLKKVTLSLMLGNFFSPTTDLYINNTELFLNLPVKKRIVIGVGFKNEWVKISDKLRVENIPEFQLFHNNEWGDFQLKNRNLFEFGIIEGELTTRFRDMFTLSYQGCKSIAPYVSTEFWFNLNVPDYMLQETFVGFELPVKKFNLNCFAGWSPINTEASEWSHWYIFGGAVSYAF